MGVRFPLHFAADFGQLKLLKFFVRIGAEVDRKDKYGITPLLAAIWEGHTRCVEFRLQMRASRTERTPEGQSYAGDAQQEDIRWLLARD
ncbi:myotrophin [Drosophila simulans]|uniref:GD15607 n=1 Tax=Drosophila simulans TaxID=7240 RepID=B4R7A3_DROSI|nr:myotrophin [Drosophila simulans]EDX18344.1 GD15607 [Drosophila simulans]